MAGRSYNLIPDSIHLRWTFSSSIRAPYLALRSILGGSGNTRLDLGNYHHAWLMVATDCAQLTFLVHDLRGDGSPEANRSDSSCVWHVHGSSEAELREFCIWLSGQVIAYRSAQPQPKKLTVASLERINQLVQQGSSMSEAMAEAAAWEPVAETADFAWPLPGQIEIESGCH